MPVCQAVQHAHQKGIIHRDLKPSNVLIAFYDGKAVPKVIDFGVAKATNQKLTERTMFTEIGSIVGTLEYMAPEQAEFNNLDIDTRADIYSLGVLLYELLTGGPPFSATQLRGAAFGEMLRMICEVEPPKPSTRLSSSDELPAIAANRKLEPRRLTSLVTGELDWIVMKAVELLARASEIYRESFGTDHPHTLNTLDSLAGAYQEVGRLPEAIDLYKQVGDSSVKMLGANNPDTLATLNNWALACHNAGRLPEAIELFEQVRDARVKVLGADHPGTLTTLNNLRHPDLAKRPTER